MYIKYKLTVEELEQLARDVYAFATMVRPVGKIKPLSLSVITNLRRPITHHGEYVFEFFGVRVYVANILESFKEMPDYAIKTKVIETLIHEMSHASQNIDITRYKTDAAYQELIENQNVYNASRYILYNLTPLSRYCPDISKGQIELSALLRDQQYEEIPDTEWYIRSILGVSYDGDINKLRYKLNNSDNVKLICNDPGYNMIIKSNGKFTDPNNLLDLFKSLYIARQDKIISII